MANTYSVWPRPFSEKTDETLESFEKQVKEDAVSQQDINLMLINQIRVLNKHMEMMTELQNSELLGDVEIEGDAH